jgi:hypothetical protein
MTMQTIEHDWVTRCSRRFLIVTLALLAATMTSAVATAQIIQQSVGGVSIDTDGLLNTAQPAAQGELAKVRAQSLEKVPADLNAPAETRKISLRRLEAVLDDCTQNNKPIPDAVKYLGGLQHIRYLLVYPEQHDIVLVGPSEGWKVDAHGSVVGVVSGRPVMQLDDLLVAFRTAQAAAQGGIRCSIDPTPEGMARMNAITHTGDREALVREMESALGMQRISVHGVPDTSHFARVLVAADYRMKRLSMNLDPSPVRGLVSYLQMVRPTGRTLTPRFWLEPKYEALFRDADGLAWELRGAGVKAMTEEDFLTSSGNVVHSGKATRTAQAWADSMTDKYAELAVADPIFGELQNCIELAIVGAVIVKDRLADKAGYSLPTLMESPALKTEVFNAPKQVDSKASVVVKGQNWIVGVSGGVAINSWAVADKAKVSDTLAPVRAKAAPAENTNWWWN